MTSTSLHYEISADGAQNQKLRFSRIGELNNDKGKTLLAFPRLAGDIESNNAEITALRVALCNFSTQFIKILIIESSS